MALLDAHAMAGADGFHLYPPTLPFVKGIHGAFPDYDPGPGALVGDYRGHDLPAGGWTAHADYEAGHLPFSGGIEDQPAIWVATVRACQGLMSQLRAWIARRQKAEFERRQKELAHGRR